MSFRDVNFQRILLLYIPFSLRGIIAVLSQNVPQVFRTQNVEMKGVLEARSFQQAFLNRRPLSENPRLNSLQCTADILKNSRDSDHLL